MGAPGSGSRWETLWLMHVMLRAFGLQYQVATSDSGPFVCEEPWTLPKAWPLAECFTKG